MALGDATIGDIEILVGVDHLDADIEVVDEAVDVLVFGDNFAETLEVESGIGAFVVADHAKNGETL